jgi:hypothetical protein
VFGGTLSVSEYSHLPSTLRAERYLALAGDALRQAAMCKGALQNSYLLMAEQWQKLAVEAAKAASPPDGSSELT